MDPKQIQRTQGENFHILAVAEVCEVPDSISLLVSETSFHNSCCGHCWYDDLVAIYWLRNPNPCKYAQGRGETKAHDLIAFLFRQTFPAVASLKDDLAQTNDLWLSYAIVKALLGSDDGLVTNHWVFFIAEHIVTDTRIGLPGHDLKVILLGSNSSL